MMEIILHMREEFNCDWLLKAYTHTLAEGGGGGWENKSSSAGEMS